MKTDKNLQNSGSGNCTFTRWYMANEGGNCLAQLQSVCREKFILLVSVTLLLKAKLIYYDNQYYVTSG